MSSKQKLLTGAVMALVLYAMCMPAAAAPVFSVSVTADENGHGTITNTNGFSSALPFSQITDPGPGGLTGVLNYGELNPPGLVGGDLILTEGLLTGDLIRFDPVTNNGSFFFYSNSDADGALADIGGPTNLNTNQLTLPEADIGGGVTGIVYTPTAGQPGFVAGAAGPVTYTFISDVPEPATILLMASGLGLLFTLIRWRRGATAPLQSRLG